MKQLIAAATVLFFCINSVASQVRSKQKGAYFNVTNIIEPQYLQSIDSSSLTEGMSYIKSFGVSFSTINGVFLNSHLSVGLGVGLQLSKYKVFPSSTTSDSAMASVNYFNKNHNLSLLPIFADFRYYPKSYSNPLMLLLNVGYAPLLNIKNNLDKTNLNGGPFVKLGVGYKVDLSETISFAPALNFNAQRFGDNTVIGAGLALGLMF